MFFPETHSIPLLVFFLLEACLDWLWARHPPHLAASATGGKEGGREGERDGPEYQTQLKAARDREGGEARGAGSGIWTGGRVVREGRERRHPHGERSCLNESLLVRCSSPGGAHLRGSFIM